jgi:hypothetical protein
MEWIFDATNLALDRVEAVVVGHDADAHAGRETGRVARIRGDRRGRR